MQQFFKIFDAFFDGILIVNQDRDVVYVNTAAETLFKVRSRSVVGKKSFENFQFGNPDLFCMENGTIGQEEQSQYFEVDFSSKKASGKVQVMIQPIQLEFLPALWLIYLHNVSDEINLTEAYRSEAKEKEIANQTIFKIQDNLKEFSEMALKDEMTGIGNYRHFEKEILQKLRECRTESNPLSLILIDVDKFKLFNDTYGHQQGDEVLRSVAKALTQSVRKTDVVARYGGEEFVIILPNCPFEALPIVAEKVRANVAATKVSYLKKPEESLSVTISLGAVTIHAGDLPTEGELKFSSMVEQSDKNLYLSKENGRNRFTISKWVKN